MSVINSLKKFIFGKSTEESQSDFRRGFIRNIKKANPRTFDCNGHSAYFFDYDSRRVSGWTIVQPKVGDILRCQMLSGRVGLFRFTRVDRCSDPKDMYFATVEDLGYEDE